MSFNIYTLSMELETFFSRPLSTVMSREVYIFTHMLFKQYLCLPSLLMLLPETLSIYLNRFFCIMPDCCHDFTVFVSDILNYTQCFMSCCIEYTCQSSTTITVSYIEETASALGCIALYKYIIFLFLLSIFSSSC